MLIDVLFLYINIYIIFILLYRIYLVIVKRKAPQWRKDAVFLSSHYRVYKGILIQFVQAVL